MTTELTGPVADYIAAVNAFDVDAAVATFAPDAYVNDARREINVDGPLRENYLRGYLDTDDRDAWDTEIAWPIFRSDMAIDSR